MPLSWNEIRARASKFSREWASDTNERAEAQTFWNEFLDVFGIKRRTVATFEEAVKKVTGTWGRIDLFWKGRLLVEHKSRGESLEKADSQAMDYIQALQSTGREAEIPRHIVLSDFASIVLHDLESETPPLEFPLSDLPNHVRHFAFIPGYQIHTLAPQDPVNIKAVELLGDLHDALEVGGYTRPDLECFLVRILFCLFAEDTALFEPEAFRLLIENHSKPDGSDLGGLLARLFQALDKSEGERSANLLEELRQLPYVNGHLFEKKLELADMTSAMRDSLLKCCAFDWSRISPAIFGSLFQGVMDSAERRALGAHYTSERDILKLVNSLFLDDLKAEFAKLKAMKSTTRNSRLREFHDRLAKLKFLDPACGCGNFLVVTYRELRLLEIELLRELHPREQGILNVQELSKLDVDAMAGIEIEEFPARIAETALWLVDHQMNQRLGDAFGVPIQRLPLKKSARIRHGNALRIDWNEVLPASECSYVLGNPPFVGKKEQTAQQKADSVFVNGNYEGGGVLDYVTNWYFKAIEYAADKHISCAFVSTNSISQGEQVAPLWSSLLKRGVDIQFAHRTFPWRSEARGAAHVHVVIIGFSKRQGGAKRLYEYDGGAESATVTSVQNISPYLIEGSNTLITSRRTSICHAPEMVYGSFALDDGYFTLSKAERDCLLSDCPEAAEFIRPFVGGKEMLYSIERYCLWLANSDPAKLRSCAPVLERIEAVRRWRSGRTRKATLALAATPTLFAEVRQPATDYIAIPTLSSEKRRYVPIGRLNAEIIASNQVYVLPSSSLWHFGVLHSLMHMSWIKQVGGTLESRYRYSNAIVYNNFPWPQKPDTKLVSAVEAAAQAVLDARAVWPTSSLADLYDPTTMPPNLTKAHAELDRAVERCYRKEPFTSDRERVEFLFKRYEELANPLTAGVKDKPKRRRKAES